MSGGVSGCHEEGGPAGTWQVEAGVLGPPQRGPPQQRRLRPRCPSAEAENAWPGEATRFPSLTFDLLFHVFLNAPNNPLTT